MDFVSHSLWGGLAFGRETKRAFLLAAVISITPDLLTEGLFGALYLLGIGGMPGWEHGHPNITDYPAFAQTLYNATHSFIPFAGIFGLTWLLSRKPVWILAAWGLHIAIDIPTHSLALFPTPFLWPLSSFKVDGIGWDNPVVIALNVIMLLTAGCLWYFGRRSNKARAADCE